MAKFYPEQWLKKTFSKRFLSTNPIDKDFDLRKSARKAIRLARARTGREIDESSIRRVLSGYQAKYEALLQSGVGKQAAFDEAVNQGGLLKQRIVQAAVYDEIQAQKAEHSGAFYRWLPSDAQNPDPEHQLLYGKVFRIGTGDKDGNMPGERYGCRCGIEWLGEAEMTAEEKMKAVDVKLGKETRLPPLNKADLERMGVKESKPVIWTKYSSARSAAKHKDITVKEYNYLVGNSLYKHIYPVFRDRKNKNYWHFIGTPETGRTSAPVVLLDVEETKNAFEIVHVHRMEANSLRRLLRKILKKN